MLGGSYGIIISSNRLIYFQGPVFSIVSNLQKNRLSKAMQYKTIDTLVSRNLQTMRKGIHGLQTGFIYYDFILQMKASTKTYSFNKITPIRICVELFVGLHAGCNLCYNLFANSIINWNRPNLKMRMLL